MDIGKYKKAMRPKKYLDGDFVVYDPSLPDASDVQLETRDTFSVGGESVIREEFSEGTKTELVEFVEKFKLENNRIPTQTEIVRGTGKAAKTVKSYLKEGVDYAKLLTPSESAKLGGRKPGEVKEIDQKAFQELKDLTKKIKGISIQITGDKSKSVGLRIGKQYQPIMDEFTGGQVTKYFPGDEKGIQQLRNLIIDIAESNIYKDNVTPFQSPDQKRAIKRAKAATYREKDPFNVYKRLQEYKTEKFPELSREIQIQHGQPKFTTQTLSRFGLIPQSTNVNEEIQKIEGIRNNEVKILNSKLKNPNTSIEDKKQIIEEFNNKMKGLRGQLKGTPAQGLVNFELYKIDDSGSITKLKDTGFDPKKGMAYGKELGDLDLSKITKEQADEIIALGKKKIDLDLLQKTTPGLTTAEKLARPESAIESEMFTKATQRWNQQEANEVLNSFCDVQKRAKGTGELACGIKEIENNLFKEGRQAIKTGAKTPRLARLGAYMTGLLGPIDIPIELAFAAPHILRGDKDAAKKAMIIGLFGAGRDKIQRANEELGPDSATSKIYNYEKALEDFAEVYTGVINAKKTLDREDLEKVPKAIQDSALESLQGGIERLKEIREIVNQGEPNIQEIVKSKQELTELQQKGTFESDDFTYLGQALSDPLQYPTRLNASLSGFTGEEGPDRTYTGEDISDPREFVEAQGDEMYPYMKEQGYLSKAVEDAFTGFTGKDLLDRYSDVKIEDLDKLPQAEKEYVEKGLRELADRIGPQAALKIAEEQGIDPSVLSGLFPSGYLERQGFAKGGMSRRDFLKLLGTAFGTIGAAKAGLLKFVGKKAATDVITTPAVAGKPEWFDAVINKVIKEGTDITEKFATKEREIIHVQQLGEQEGARVIRDLDTGEIRLEYESPTNMGEEPVTFTYKPAEQLEEGKTVPARFEANEAEPRVVNWDGDIEFDDEFVTENVDELMSDTSTLKQYGTGKLDEKDLKIRQIKTQKVQKINADTSETLEYLESSDRGVMSGRSVQDYLYEAKRVGDIKDTGEPLMNPNVIIKGKPKK